MYKFVQELQHQLDSCGAEPLFEIEVVDGRGEQDWVVCDVGFRGNSIVAWRTAVSTKERRAKHIARTKLVCDSAFGLGHHLQELWEEVVEDILRGDLFELSEPE